MPTPASIRQMRYVQRLREAARDAQKGLPQEVAALKGRVTELERLILATLADDPSPRARPRLHHDPAANSDTAAAT